MSLATNPMGDLLPCSNEDVNDILCDILNLNLLDSSREKPIVSTINCLLSSSNTRQQGLEYLNLIINNFSTEAISENALNWTNHCLVKYSGDILKEIKLITIGNIVTNAHNSPDFQKKFVSDYISKVIDMCLTDHKNPNEIAASLDTLTICMKVYSSWFGNQRGKIESFLLKFLEQRSTKLVDRAANGFLYMQQIGNAGLEGVIHKNNFSMTVSKLCATLQHLFRTFFENDPEFDSNAYNTDQEGFNFSTLECDSQKMFYVTTRRITNCLKFLMVMLRKSFPVSKEIKPEEILDVIRCGLNVHRCLAEGENTLEDYQTAVLLIDVQTQCLNLLRVLIVWGQSHLIPSAHTVSKILIDTLRMSHKCPCFSSNSIFQETVYKTLLTWIRVAKSTFHSHFQNDLVTHILQDILPAKSTVTLNIDMDLNNTKSKKAKRKAVQDKVIASSILNNHESERTLKAKHKEKICIFALNTLKQLMIATDLKIKTVLLKEIYSVITGTLLDLTYSNFVHPYTNPVCQEKLYEVMVSFYEQTTSNIYPHLQVILTILNRGVAHHNLHIAHTCEHGLSILEKLCQPLYPPLYSPVGDEQQESNTVEISFQSHTEQLNVDDIETRENVYDVITTDNVARSPAWSLETEVLNNSFEGDIKDNLQIQDNVPLNNKITIIQNDVISQQNEEVSLSNESSNVVTNDEPCTKKIKLSLSQEEAELNINTSADIKFEKFSQEQDNQAILKSESNNSPINSCSKDSLDTASINISENYTETINVSTTEEGIQVQVASFEEKRVSTKEEEITVQVASFEEKKVSTAEEDITLQVAIFEEKIETVELLEDSFIDEVKNY